ncbi:MAG: polysaccharide deacetylase family protein [Terricaulis sp.]|nr:polysaccharide deacetylase family protein [Terricaulis sp.]
MALDDDYLNYPHRSYGMDQERYAWRKPEARKRCAWPGEAAVAAMIVVPLEFHMLNPAGKPFKHPGAMVTPYPDLRHYTTRDYGNRVGVFRILDALRDAKLKAVFPINANMLERVEPLVDRIVNDGHEIAAYGLATDKIHWGGLDPEEEKSWISQTRAAFDAFGLKPRTWMSPARQQSFQTLDLIAEAGFDVCLDWENDNVPIDMQTKHGIVRAVPLFNELDDRILLIDRRQSEDEWAAQILAARDLLAEEAPALAGKC